MAGLTYKSKSKGKSSHRRNKKRSYADEIKQLRDLIPGLRGREEANEVNVILESVNYINQLENSLLSRLFEDSNLKIDHLEGVPLLRALIQNCPRVEASTIPTIQSSGASPYLTSDEEENG